MSKRVMVVGGAGFIGSHVVEQCLQAGYEVAVVDNLSSGKRANLPEGIAFYLCDIEDPTETQHAFLSFKPSHVIHLAAQISVSRSVLSPVVDARTNILGLLNTLQNAVAVEAESFIFSSSGGVLYGNVDNPANESRQASPISPYGISKLCGEYYVQFFSRQYGLTCTVLRYANVYGPRQDPRGEAGVVAIFLDRLLGGKPSIIHGDGNQIRDFVYVLDVAIANMRVLECIRSGFKIYNVGTGVATTVTELEKEIRNVVRSMIGFSDVPPPVYGPSREADLTASILDASSIKTDLGWGPSIGIKQGLMYTAQWFFDRMGYCK